jgi:hypothetical protein
MSIDRAQLRSDAPNVASDFPVSRHDDILAVVIETPNPAPCRGAIIAGLAGITANVLQTPRV